MLAGVAFKALTNAAQGAGAGVVQAPAASGALPVGLAPPSTQADQQALENMAQLVLKAMINMAKSDGQVSPDEIQRIVGKAGEAGSGAADQAWLMTELSRPLDLDAFVAEIPSQEVAAEIYAASLIASEIDTQAERDYLRQLAEKTRLHPAVVQHIHQTLGVPV